MSRPLTDRDRRMSARRPTKRRHADADQPASDAQPELPLVFDVAEPEASDEPLDALGEVFN